MRVLHLPTNIASQVSVTVRAMRDIGIEARGLVFNNAPVQDDQCIEPHLKLSRRRHPIRARRLRLAWQRAVLEAIRWADVVHWHSHDRVLPWDLDLRYVRRAGKVRVVEFWGTEVRVPAIACADNPYMAEVYAQTPSLAGRAEERSKSTQRRFAAQGFACVVPGQEIGTYIQDGLFTHRLQTQQRILLADYEPHYPAADNTRPLVIHTPSRRVGKGTDAVLRAVESLRATHDFEFRLIQGVPRAEALSIMKSCDIMLDQFQAGDHGLAALEAMAFGKPTLCYVKPSLAERHAADLAIVNANPDNLADVLRELLRDGTRRHALGAESRAYVEKYHDAHKVARQLVDFYKELGRMRA